MVLEGLCFDESSLLVGIGNYYANLLLKRRPVNSLLGLGISRLKAHASHKSFSLDQR